jgi:hypothetical protein
LVQSDAGKLAILLAICNDCEFTLIVPKAEKRIADFSD